MGNRGARRWWQRRAGMWRKLRLPRGQALLGEGGCSAGARHGAGGRRRREDGQALVEFALVLPVLLMLVTAILQFGLLFNKYITLTDAVRSGARTLALGRGLSDPCDPAVTQTVNSGVGISLTASQVTTTLPSPDSCGTGSYPNRTGGTEVQGDEATVTATEPYSVKVFGLTVYSGQLSASASDAIE
jgi:Flp pilus assembly protein TadG